MRSPITVALFAFAAGLLLGVLAPREAPRAAPRCELSCLPGETLYSYTSTVTGPSLACRAGAVPSTWRAMR